MFTRRGYTVVGAAIALFVAGRILGTVELWILGTAALALTIGGLIWIRLRALPVDASRHTEPRFMHAGTEGRIELALRNHGRRSTPVLNVADAFDDGRQAARFVLPPIPPGATRPAAYRIPTNRRGRYRVGPLRASVEDPFGFVRRARTLLGSTTVVVFPRVHALTPLSSRPGSDRRHGGPRERQRSFAGDDFLSLRSYVVGDDLRRVHWRSTARVGELMVRQDEAPWRAPPVLVLDVRAEAYDESSFERAVEAAASIAALLGRMDSGFDAYLGNGRDLHPRIGLEHILSELATVDVDAAGGLTLAPFTQHSSGAVILITGGLDASAATALTALTGRRRRVMAFATDTPTAPLSKLPADVLVVDASHRPIATAWNDAARLWNLTPARG
jgi:uncharacterized protein (DUF58 family)